jgi:SAM-dependent MidA family methyltransferase
MTVAAFMELALYHPQYGYYATRGQRSGRSGDFYTSVDVGSLFGELLAVQIAEMARRLGGEVDLVEVAAGNGRLTRDVLEALERDVPDVYSLVRVRLVERSAAARGAQAAVLGRHAAKLSSSDPDLPGSMTGVIFANELLDALPVHVVTTRGGELREIVVAAEGDRLVKHDRPVVDASLLEAVSRGPRIPEGVLVEVNLAALEWIQRVAGSLARGFLLVIDYGDDALALRSEGRPEGTLRAFSSHRVSGNWLEHPGEQDLTSHVDFTAVSDAATRAGLELLGRVDQTRFLLGLGAVERLDRDQAALAPAAALRRRLAAKSLIVPGGMGSAHHVLIFGKNVGGSALAGLSLLR